MKSRKVETIEQYVARGGTIKKIPTCDAIIKEQAKKPLSNGPAVILSMDEADLYYGEGKVKKPQPKGKVKIDLSALPESLRKKYTQRALEEAGIDEKEFEEKI